MKFRLEGPNTKGKKKTNIGKSKWLYSNIGNQQRFGLALI
jgi:hypothetical protein